MNIRIYTCLLFLALMTPVVVLAQAEPVPQGAGQHVPAEADRKQDDRRLNQLATQFYAIKAQDPDAVKKLGHLLHKVHVFRNALKTRSYDVADISKDAHKLAWRIDSQRKKLIVAQVQNTPVALPESAGAAPVSVPSVVMPSPGTPLRVPPVAVTAPAPNR